MAEEGRMTEDIIEVEITYSERRKPKQLVNCKEGSKSRRSRVEQQVSAHIEKKAERIDRNRRDRADKRGRGKTRTWRAA